MNSMILLKYKAKAITVISAMTLTGSPIMTTNDEVLFLSDFQPVLSLLL